jgi:hypothetical protein|tara:strand:- start:6555 stop:7988 length:1434 start_codon:yes stop_codon:yes gene_type:complete
MEEFKILTTKEKALQLNLDTKVYGTIAEIGGGQEVANHFFKAGAASGTIAKTMSAYDMTFSDAIYGKSIRYVCEDKLNKMLDREYSLLSQRLTQRSKRSTFFAFANTVETINFGKTNEGHGWVGLRFQKHALSLPNNCIIHILLKDNDAQWQQQLLGMIGVNLIHSCFNYTDPEEIILALADNLSKDRFEIDMFSISGPDFHHVDNRLMSLLLVKNGLSHAAMFGPKGNVLQASEALYKKNVLVLRGRFRPVTNVNVDMMINGLKLFKEEEGVDSSNLITLTELTLQDLASEGAIDETDYLDRVDLLCSLGQTVLLSNYIEHYKLASFLSNITQRMKLRIICGLGNLERIFDETYYDNLKGGILESFGRLFALNVNLYIYPAIYDGKVKSISDFHPALHLEHLYHYLITNKRIINLKGANTKLLYILSDDVLKLIKDGNPAWELMVPRRVSQIIKNKKMFDLFVPLMLDQDEEEAIY